jgi:hypothetical protein
MNCEIQPIANRLYKRYIVGVLGEPANTAGGSLVIIRRLIAPLIMAVIAVHTSPVLAQSAFPLPGAAAAPSNDPAFPPVNGTAPGAMIGSGPSTFPSAGAPPGSGGFARPQQGPPGGEDCMNGFLPLRQEAERRGAMIKTASDRHATPDETCKLFVAYGQSELRMIKYIESRQANCGIPPEIGDRLRSGRKNTEVIQKKVCDAARQQRPTGPSLDLQPIGPFAARDHGLPLAAP